MVKQRMDLLELLRKRGMDGDVDFLREALRVLVDGIKVSVTFFGEATGRQDQLSSISCCRRGKLVAAARVFASPPLSLGCRAG